MVANFNDDREIAFTLTVVNESNRLVSSTIDFVNNRMWGFLKPR